MYTTLGISLSKLGCFRSRRHQPKLLELYGTDVSKRQVLPRRVVEPLDLIEHIWLGLPTRAVAFAGHALCLQDTEEAPHCRVVPNFASTLTLLTHPDQLVGAHRTCSRCVPPT